MIRYARPLAATLALIGITLGARTILADPGTPDGPSGIDWDAAARCRSGSNWAHPPVELNQSGFTYAGGLMLYAPAWQRYGGLEFAASPDLASRDEQIAVAEAIAADPITGGVEFARTLQFCASSYAVDGTDTPGTTEP